MAFPFRFRRFGPRLLFFIAGLVAAAQATTYVLVSRANRQNALAVIGEALDRGARQFSAIARRREEDLLLAARMMAGDYALRQPFLPRINSDTALSALRSYVGRINTSSVVLLDADGAFIADAETTAPNTRHAPFFSLQARADLDESAKAAGRSISSPRASRPSPAAGISRPTSSSATPPAPS